MSAVLPIAAAHAAPVTARGGPDLEAMGRAAAAAAQAGARLLVLPELAPWPFFPIDDPAHWRHVAEPLEGWTVSAAAGFAAQHGIALLVPFVLARAEGRPLNAVALAAPDAAPRLVATKIHIPPRSGEDAFGEADHFDAGEPEVSVFDVGGFMCAVLVCYDRRFPETWRAARAAGAQLVIAPVSGPSSEADDFFLCELRTHARENGVYAVAAARTGTETIAGRSIRHSGASAIVAPTGEVVAARTARDEPGLVLAQIDRGILAEARQRFPYFETRRALRTQQTSKEELQ
jgi:predicted amidohydrolase